MKFSAGILFLLALLQTTCALANVGAFGGNASDITLVNDANIQMVSEDVSIKLVPSDKPVTGDLKNWDEARFDCEFTMKNLSSKSAEVQVGFPLSSSDNFMLRDAKNIIEKHNFKAFVDGREVQVRYVDKSSDSKFKCIFVWKMLFAPKGVSKLKITYKMLGYNGLGITQNPPYNWELTPKEVDILQSSILQSYQYVTITGNSWKGKIESAKFSLDIGEFERYLVRRGFFAYDDSHPYADKRKSSPYNFGMLYRYISPDGWKLSADGERIEWRYENFSPKENIKIQYHFTTFPRDTNALKKLLDFICASDSRPPKHIKILSPNEKKNIADTILEYYGINTGNAELKNFLKHQIWYPVKNPPKIDGNLKSELLKLSGIK